MNTEQVFETIKSAYLEQAKLDSRLASDAVLSAGTVLLGKEGLLDSMSVVAFLLELEERFKMNLLDEVMAEAQKRPAYSLGDLSQLIEKRNS